MSLQPLNWPGFGSGLDVNRATNGDGSRCIDAMNVLFETGSAVYSRTGYDTLITGTVGTPMTKLAVFQKRSGERQIVVAAGLYVKVYTTTGTLVSTSSAFTSDQFVFAKYGTAAINYIYVTNGVDVPRKWDGASWTTVSDSLGASLQAKTAVAVPFDYRVAFAGFTGTTGNSPSTIKFSNPGTDATFGSSIDINPGDGEGITAMVAYQQQLFVFKNNSMHVVYGQTTSGSPSVTTWNWRTLVDNVGCAGPDALTVGPDGVYFAHRSGIYVTAGAVPVCVSAPIESVFTGVAPIAWKGGIISQNYLYKSSMQWHAGRLRFSCPVNGSDTLTRVFVFDTKAGWWSVGDQRYNAMAVGAVDTAGQNLLCATEQRIGATAPRVVVERANSSTDSGTPINARWLSDWTDLGLAQRKTSNGVRIWGEGNVWVTLLGDFGLAGLPQQASFLTQGDTWGTAGGGDTWGNGTTADLWGDGGRVQSAYLRQGVRGTTMAMQFYSADLTPWRIHRATPQLRSLQPIGTTTGGE